MSGFLLDTNVVSELVRPRPNPNVSSWVNGTDESLLFLSVLTLGEIRKGIVAVRDSARRAVLESWFSGDLLLRFSNRVLPIDEAVADRWGRLAALAPRKSPIPVIDGLLAATAMHHNLTFVTRNVRDVAAASVSLFNPWDSSS